VEKKNKEPDEGCHSSANASGQALVTLEPGLLLCFARLIDHLSSSTSPICFELWQKYSTQSNDGYWPETMSRFW